MNGHMEGKTDSNTNDEKNHSLNKISDSDADGEGFAYLWLIPDLWAAPFHSLPADSVARSERKSLRHALLAALAALTIVIRPVANSLNQNNNTSLTLNAFVLSIVFAVIIDFMFARWPKEQREHARIMGLMTLLFSVSAFILIESLQTDIPFYADIAQYIGTLQASILFSVIVVSIVLGINTFRMGSMGGRAIRDIIVVLIFSSSIISIFTLIDNATMSYLVSQLK